MDQRSELCSDTEIPGGHSEERQLQEATSASDGRLPCALPQGAAASAAEGACVAALSPCVADVVDAAMRHTLLRQIQALHRGAIQRTAEPGSEETQLRRRSATVGEGYSRSATRQHMGSSLRQLRIREATACCGSPGTGDGAQTQYPRVASGVDG